MPPPKTSGPDPRYTFRAATMEVGRIVERLGKGSQKAIALGIGINEQQMSAKLRGKTDEMTLDQLGRIATLLHAPAGWPWIAWSEDDLIQAIPRLKRVLGTQRP